MKGFYCMQIHIIHSLCVDGYNLYFNNTIVTCTCIIPLLPLVSINCTYGSVRLVNGSTEREGRPEVCWNGIDWIPVSSTWSTNNQRIICNYLGYGAIGKHTTPNSNRICY